MTDEKLPPLESIRDPRHPGVSAAVCESYSEAAEVALDRHHDPPATEFSLECLGERRARVLEWARPKEAGMRAWNNRDDATRDGAYIVAIAAVEAELGLVAILRAETRTGADYYVGEPGQADLEQALRLEVSGVDKGDESTIRARLRQKLNQAERGQSNLPAIAAVVGFRAALIAVEQLESADE